MPFFPPIEILDPFVFSSCNDSHSLPEGIEREGEAPAIRDNCSGWFPLAYMDGRYDTRLIPD